MRKIKNLPTAVGAQQGDMTCKQISKTKFQLVFLLSGNAYNQIFS